MTPAGVRSRHDPGFPFELRRKLGGHHPRKRMIQSSPSVKHGDGGDDWMPAFAGMTSRQVFSLI